MKTHYSKELKYEYLKTLEIERGIIWYTSFINYLLWILSFLLYIDIIVYFLWQIKELIKWY